MLSRALLVPGPLPPSSHLGLTLLRHVAGSGLRYALYHLGLPIPEAPPVRLVRLRFYLDGDALLKTLDSDAAAVAVREALLDPGGVAQAALPARLRATVAFHRLRLRLVPRRLPRPAAAPPPADPEALWNELRHDLSRSLRATDDALLAELVAALERRDRRRRGESQPPVLSRAAGAMRDGGRPPLERFGPPDPLRPSWARALDREGAARAELAATPPPPAHALRGRFRETHRALLERWTRPFGELARQACERRLIAEPDDAYFLPLETADDLTSTEPLRWLGAAIAANRREYAAYLQAAEPGDLLGSAHVIEGPSGPRPEWELAPLLPLP